MTLISGNLRPFNFTVLGKPLQLTWIPSCLSTAGSAFHSFQKSCPCSAFCYIFHPVITYMIGSSPGVSQTSSVKTWEKCVPALLHVWSEQSQDPSVSLSLWRLIWKYGPGLWFPLAPAKNNNSLFISSTLFYNFVILHCQLWSFEVFLLKFLLEYSFVLSHNFLHKLSNVLLLYLPKRM